MHRENVTIKSLQGGWNAIPQITYKKAPLLASMVQKAMLQFVVIENLCKFNYF